MSAPASASKGPVPKAGILEIAPYVGGESHVAGLAQIVKLSSNENAFGASPLAEEAYVRAATELHRYPDGGHERLRKALAARYRLDPARIVCGSGSDELIVMLTRAYAGPGEETLYSEHEFLMYPIATLSAGATPVKVAETNLTVDVDKLLAAATPRTRIVFVANPNNPTGTYITPAAMRRLRDGLPRHVLIVVDGAYTEFVTARDYSASLELVEPDGNLCVLRTFSKIYGLAGLRLGWGYFPTSVADVLNRVRGPFNVSLPALAAGEAALADTAFVDKLRAHNETWREWTRAEIAKLGLEVTPGAGNFLLIHFPQQEGRDSAAADRFLKTKGIIVRRMHRYGLGQCLRVTIGTEAQMRAFAAAVGAFVAAKGKQP